MTFLKEGLKVLVDVGKYDFLANWIGNEDWLENLNWPYKEQWHETDMDKIIIDNKYEGDIKSLFNLTFALVDDAGHKVVEDRPDVALSLILSLTYGTEI